MDDAEARSPGAGPRRSLPIEAEGPAATRWTLNLVATRVAVPVRAPPLRLTVFETRRPGWVSAPALRVAARVTTLSEPVAVVAMLVVAALVRAATTLPTGWVTLSTVDATTCPSDPAAAPTEPGEDACPLAGPATSTADAPSTARLMTVVVSAAGLAAASVMAARGLAAAAEGAARASRHAIPAKPTALCPVLLGRGLLRTEEAI